MLIKVILNYYKKNKLILLILLHLFFYFVFTFLNKNYQHYDSAGHINITIRITEHLKNIIQNNGASNFLILLTESNYYPPLFYYIVSIFNLIFGYSVFINLFIVFVTFLLTLFFYYKLLIILGFSKEFSLITTTIYSFLPLVSDQARLFHLESPLSLLLVLSYIYLAKSKGFTNKFNTILFFVLFGFLQLIKWYSFLYLIIPVILNIFYNKKDVKLKKLLPNITLGSILFLLISTPWYIVNFTQISYYSGLYSGGELTDPQVFLSAENLFFYLRGILIYQLYLIPSILVFLGFLLYFKKYNKLALFTFTHFLLIYIVFTIIENKNQRYLFSLNLLYPFFITYFLYNIKNKLLNYFTILIVLLGFIISTFNSIEPFSNNAKIVGILLNGPYYEYFSASPYMYSYDPYKAPIDQILTFINKDAVLNDIKSIGITPFIDYKYISTSNLEMVRLLNQYNNMYFPIPYYQYEPFKSDYDILLFLTTNNINYVLVPQYSGPTYLRNYQALEQSIDFMKNRSSVWYDPIMFFENGDNDVTLYRLKKLTPEYSINSCKNFTNTSNSFTIAPLSTMVFYTNSFEYNGYTKNTNLDIFYIIELINYTLDLQPVNITGLPFNGYNTCHLQGSNINMQHQIKSLLFNENNYCNNKECVKVEHIKLNLQDINEKSEIIYTKKDFIE